MSASETRGASLPACNGDLPVAVRSLGREAKLAGPEARSTPATR